MPGYSFTVASIHDAWAIATAYAEGAYVVPTVPNGHRYQVTEGGTSHATAEPVWPTDGGSVSDNEVTWIDRGLYAVTPSVPALLRLRQESQPLGFESAEVEGSGLTYWRRAWAKTRLRVEVEGWAPPDFSGVDFSGPIALTLTTLASVAPNGASTWTTASYIVYALPPTVVQSLDDGRYSWSLDAVEASASLPSERNLAFSLGGVSPSALAKFTLSRTVQDLGGGRVLVRRANGAAHVRQLWAKRAIVVAGSGWACPDFSALDLTASHTLTIGDETYTVVAQPVRSGYDLHRAQWDWTLTCEEA